MPNSLQSMVVCDRSCFGWKYIPLNLSTTPFRTQTPTPRQQAKWVNNKYCLLKHDLVERCNPKESAIASKLTSISITYRIWYENSWQRGLTNNSSTIWDHFWAKNRWPTGKVCSFGCVPHKSMWVDKKSWGWMFLSGWGKYSSKQQFDDGRIVQVLEIEKLLQCFEVQAFDSKADITVWYSVLRLLPTVGIALFPQISCMAMPTASQIVLTYFTTSWVMSVCLMSWDKWISAQYYQFFWYLIS